MSPASWWRMVTSSSSMVGSRVRGAANWIAADILCIENGILVERWDVLQDEATEDQSKSKSPMFGTSFAKPVPRAAPTTATSPLTVEQARAIMAPLYGALN